MMRIVIIASIALLLQSCSTPQHLFQNNDIDQVETNMLDFFNAKAPTLVAGDKLTISIWGHENLSIGSVNSIYNSNEASGKWLLVNDEGEVNLPKLGRVKISGYTVKEANYFLEQSYKTHLKDPIINVKVLNHYVTVLGEVNKPGKYPLNNESMNVVQIIGEASGLSPYAQNNKVEIVRVVNGQSRKLNVDLTDLMSAQFHNINLLPNDIVYIAPKQSKDWNRKIEKAAPLASIITAVAVLISVFAK